MSEKKKCEMCGKDVFENSDLCLDDRAVNFSKNVDHDFYSQVLYYAIMNVIGDKK